MTADPTPSGAAAFTTTSLAQGSHSITATYGGDANDAATSSAALTQVVNSPAAPSAPTNLTATSAGSSQINLAWTASSTSGVAYNVYGSTTSGFTPSASNRLATGVSTTTYSATGLSGSATYYFRVTATKSGVESTDSNQASAATSGGPSCHVVYTVSSQWGNGFNGAFSIENTGSTAMTSWTLTWAWAGKQEMTQSWNANYKQSGTNVTLTKLQRFDRSRRDADRDGLRSELQRHERIANDVLCEWDSVTNFLVLTFDEPEKPTRIAARTNASGPLV